MKKFQKLGYMAIGGLLTAVIMVTTPVLAAGMYKQITVYHNNIKLYVDGALATTKGADGKVVEPFIYEGTTYLPVRAVAEALGKSASWDGATQSVYLGEKPGVSQYMTDVLPAYQSTTQDSTARYKEYSALKSGGAESFYLGGVKYLDGFTITNSRNEAWAVWNTNSQYQSMTATLCHVDGTDVYVNSSRPHVLLIYCDGVLRDEISVSPSMSPKPITINLAGVNQLKIVMPYTYSSAHYGFGNPIIK